MAAVPIDHLAEAPLEKEERLFQPRRYQNEMLKQSLKQNTIVAMDTGSGKTAIAVLRIREELERCSKSKIVWFLVPTVALAIQQRLYITQQLPAFPTRVLSGQDGVDTWSTQAIWDKALLNIDIVVCTHQVLLDALSHGFVHMKSIALLVFDEAHHCTLDHPANRILQNFYHPLKRDSPQDIPYILGLTASPVTSVKENSLQTIEQNLDAISRTPKENRDELMLYVHRPVMTTVFYTLIEPSPSVILAKLMHVHESTDIRKDPYVLGLAARKSPLYRATILNRKTYTQEQMNTFLREARRIEAELGAWASAEYIHKCSSRYIQTRNQASELLMGDEVEKRYLSNILSALRVDELNEPSKLTPDGVSDKVSRLIGILMKDMSTDSAGIIFVMRRADVALLSMILRVHPATKDFLRVGTFVGTSEFGSRSNTLSRLIEMKNQESTLDDLRSGIKNLIICTSVCEEGIDVSACNFVICFDPPPNLKSMIQRRGRARHSKSRFTLMLQENGHTSEDILVRWLVMEKEMEKQYMDDMRELRELKEIESQDDEHREFIIEATGAKLTLHNAVQHLYHFCNKLPQAEHTVLVPLFSYETLEDENEMEDSGGKNTEKLYTCRVLLPIAVDASIREFCSQKAWASQKMARRDTAFEAYTRLHAAGLINTHLLPTPALDEGLTKAYAEIAKRPSEIETNDQFSPWSSVAAAWESTTKVYQYTISMKQKNEETFPLRIVSPVVLPNIPEFTLYIDSTLSYGVKLSGPVAMDRNSDEMSSASTMTELLLRPIYQSKAPSGKSDFPLLFVPSTYDSYWMEKKSETYPGTRLTSDNGPPYDSVGIVRDQKYYGKSYVFQGVEWRQKEGLPEDATEQAQYLRCKPLPKRRDFLHPIPANQPASSTQSVLLDPETCTIDSLPYHQARLALFIPSISHKIELALTTTHLCRTILAPVNLTNPNAVLPAISTAVAQEGSDYQRLEFLGDSILKTCTSISLVADHPKWHEGYLSNHKDQIVSNGRLAVAAQQTGIDKYIRITPFTGHKWKPLYNSDLLTHRDALPTRKMSTKTLADVVEALLGVAFLDGGFPKALRLLQIFIPEVPWRSLESWSATLLDAAVATTTSSSSSSLTNNSDLSTNNRLNPLESLLGYTFAHKSLLVEALTHPSYPSTTATPTTSYQRLEFLGDALLDYLVTTTIFRHAHARTLPLQLHKMHLLRTASVNASFLAFRSLSTNASISTSTNSNPLTLTSFLRAAPSTTLHASLSQTHARYTHLSTLLHTTLSNHTAAYPWRLLAAFAPDKLVSDLVEAVIAAVWVDSGGSWEACEGVTRKLGVLGWVEERVRAGGGGCWHPKEEVGMLAGERRVRYEVSCCVEAGVGDGRANVSSTDVSLANTPPPLRLGKGPHTCRLLVGDVAICEVSGWNRAEVEVAAAEEGVRRLRAARVAGNGAGVAHVVEGVEAEEQVSGGVVQGVVEGGDVDMDMDGSSVVVQGGAMETD